MGCEKEHSRSKGRGGGRGGRGRRRGGREGGGWRKVELVELSGAPAIGVGHEVGRVQVRDDSRDDGAGADAVGSGLDDGDCGNTTAVQLHSLEMYVEVIVRQQTGLASDTNLICMELYGSLGALL